MAGALSDGRGATGVFHFAAERDRLRVVDDQRGGPMPAADVAEARMSMGPGYGMRGPGVQSPPLRDRA